MTHKVRNKRLKEVLLENVKEVNYSIHAVQVTLLCDIRCITSYSEGCTTPETLSSVIMPYPSRTTYRCFQLHEWDRNVTEHDGTWYNWQSKKNFCSTMASTKSGLLSQHLELLAGIYCRQAMRVSAHFLSWNPPATVSVRTLSFIARACGNAPI
jgi:hypothetical protein